MFSKRYLVNDTKKSEHSPLKGSYVWNVPKGTDDGMYYALLEIGRTDRVVQSYIEPFVIAKYNGTLIISKFYDSNANGIRNNNEMMLPGWHFMIKSLATNAVFAGITGENGTITISNIPAGIYEVEEERRAGFMATTPEIQNIYLKNGSTTYVEFGNYNVSAPLANKNSGMLPPPLIETIIKTSPPGASINIDDVYIGETPITVNLTPGMHAFKFNLDAYKSVVVEHNISGSRPYIINEKLNGTPIQQASTNWKLLAVLISSFSVAFLILRLRGKM